MGINYCDRVKNITVTLDDKTYREARMFAAEQETSVSSLVREHLESLVRQRSMNEGDRKREKLAAAFDKAQQKSAGRSIGKFNRDEIIMPPKRLKLR